MPEFTYAIARQVYESLAPKPAPEPPRLAAARKLLEKTPVASRDRVGGEIIRRADGPDEAMALHALVTEQLAADVAQAAEDLARTIAEALAEPAKAERPAPYLDDSGNLRDPAGNPVDTASEDWWHRRGPTTPPSCSAPTGRPATTPAATTDKTDPVTTSKARARR